ncbi:MAG: 4Fe-4S dicluster domain-containing protein, partial [Vampirovibrionia bacterium]
IEEIISLYENKTPLTQDDLAKIQEIKNEVGTNFCRRCCYCEPCPQNVKIFAAMAIPRVMKNYGNNYSAEWFVEGAKSIDNCLQCGICETKCPYSLPIMQTIKENKDYFEANYSGKL